MLHPKCKYCFNHFLQLVKTFLNMKICVKSTRTYFQNMEFIELFLNEIQVKHWCNTGWEYITAKYDLAVVQPKVIRFA